MLWKLKKQRQQEEIIQEDMKKEEKKNKKKNLKTIPSGAGATTSSSSSSSSSSTSSSFSISRFLPFSWISSKLMPKTKRSTTSRTAPDPNQKPKSIAFSAPVPPAPPRRSPGFPSSHESFRRTAAADLDGESSRFPPPVIAGVGIDVPHRRSLGDDDAGRPPKLDQCWRAERRRHHHSVGDLQLPELRHLLQLSDPLGAAESNGGSDASSDYELQSPPRQQQPRGRRRSNAARPSEGDRTDAGPRKSFSGKTRRQRTRPKVKISSPRPSASATTRRKRGPAVDEEKEKEKMRELERFAVVKRSQDPQRDFRESMVEMIWERGIGRPEELESLLACYLSLNADEHHDVIVKVFRQVWFELNPELFSQYCY